MVQSHNLSLPLSIKINNSRPVLVATRGASGAHEVSGNLLLLHLLLHLPLRLLCLLRLLPLLLYRINASHLVQVATGVIRGADEINATYRLFLMPHLLLPSSKDMCLSKTSSPSSFPQTARRLGGVCSMYIQAIFVASFLSVC